MTKVFKQGYKDSPLQETLFGMGPAPQRCAGCNKEFTLKDIKYALCKSGQTKEYCQPCAKKILRPQEEAVEV